MKKAPRIKIILPILFISLNFLFSQKKSGLSYGFGFSGLQYSPSENNAVFNFPATFSARVQDDNGKILLAEKSFGNNRVCKGFTAHIEYLAFSSGEKNLYHGPDFFLSYQKDEILESTIYGFGYFFRFKPDANSNSGFSAGIHLFLNNNFLVEMDPKTFPSPDSYTFGGKDFGDTVTVVFSELKSSLFPEMTYHLAFTKKLELRFSFGYFFSFKSAQKLKITSEDKQNEFVLRNNIYAPSGSAANFPVVAPGYFMFRAGIYFLDFF